MFTVAVGALLIGLTNKQSMDWATLEVGGLILIGLALGILLGTLIGEYWTKDSWENLGVKDAALMMKGQGTAPQGPNEAAGWTAQAVVFLALANKFIGSLFLQSLKFIAVPIVFFSLIGAVAGVGDVRKIGRIGLKTLACFFFTLVV